MEKKKRKIKRNFYDIEKLINQKDNANYNHYKINKYIKIYKMY